MNKPTLIQKIKTLDGLSQDERAYLINLVNTKKKYGMVELAFSYDGQHLLVMDVVMPLL